MSDSMRKRQLQQARRERKQKKDDRREQRKTDTPTGPATANSDSGDPDLAGIYPGPQHQRDMDTR